MINIQNKIQEDIEAVVEKYREKGVSYCDIIGTLEVVKLNVWDESCDANENTWN